MNIPDKQALIDAVHRIKDQVHQTPILSSTHLNKLSGAELFFKCENFQKGGSYKLRGALNATKSLSPEKLSNGIATHSSGNFAQAVAISAKICHTKAHIVMPTNAPIIKKKATEGYGADITFCEPTLADRENTLSQIIERTSASKLHPSNDIPVIVGQGTCAYELLQEQEQLDYIIAPVGGGGVVAGTILSCIHFSANTRVIGAEPANADDAYKSLEAGKIVPSVSPDTIADGLRTQLGDNNFPIIQQHIDQIIRVEEHEIIEAMILIWERMKIIVEPSSAVTLSAVLKRKEIFEGKKVGLIITGGNVDIRNLPFK